MKEFNCKVTSTGSSCGREKEMAFTHQPSGKKGRARIAHLDHIIGPRWKSDAAYINNHVKIWDSWDHYPIYVVVQEDETLNYFSARRRKRWTGWRPDNDEATIEFQKAVMDKNDDKQEENLETIEKCIEEAARNVAHTAQKLTETKPWKKHRRM